MKKIVLLILLFAVAPIFTYADDKSKSEEDALKLFWELILKLKENTPFTLQDDEYFFGKLPNYNPTALFYEKFGYIDFSKSMQLGEAVILKPLPKLSFYGELLRMYRNEITYDIPPVFIHSSMGKIIDSNGRISVDDCFITVFAISKNRIIHMDYDVFHKNLISPMYLNSKPIDFDKEKIAELENVINNSF